ncbi:ferric reductase like transmembrane component-domain-containing protein [Podospora didyma]|uniref:Ferric reductase like transmembrane component-domain-containing protein n=1 Tax=Podospora didyma TaxID=330526 RepID=A0AAE0NP85_9PEZI|nr:ferric reductase like transmembrane component-domain-containing protein [Podospora didyma]
MRPFTAFLWLASNLILGAIAEKVASGLDGYGLDPTGDWCMWGCYWTISPLGLECSKPGDINGISTLITSPACRASDTSFLTTLAWCMHQRCTYLRVWELEAKWDGSANVLTGTPGAKWTYTEALQHVQANGPPTRELPSPTNILNFTAVVPEGRYLLTYNGLGGIQREQIASNTYGIIVLVVGFGAPIILTWLGYLPYMSRLLDKLNPRILYPSSIGRYQVAPLPYLIGNAPTRGQALAILGYFILNLLVSTIDYRSFQPQGLRPNLSVEIGVYVLYRTGIIAFALLPLLLLFSSRNNVLLHVTNWSHATYLLLHRWVARLFCIHALVHTIVALPNFYATDAKKPYWIWGAVATVAMALILLTSVLWVRRQWYEAFLAVHIVLAVITIAGCWYHVVLWIGMGTYGYETWLYVACAVWFFDRLARAARVVGNALEGSRRAHVVELDGPGGEYVRVDIPGLRWGTGDPGTHVYAYFPTLSLWRQPWENHPFSLVPAVLLHRAPKGEKSLPQGGNKTSVDEVVGSSSRSDSSTPTPTTGKKSLSVHVVDDEVVVDVEKSSPPPPPTATGITLFIKKAAGVTKHLRADSRLFVLLDGPYPNTPTREIRRCDRLLLIAGGVGITSVLPWIANHPNVKVCWSLRESARCLIAEVEELVSQAADRDVRVGSRLNFDDLLAREVVAGWEKVGVVVSGPGGLCDDVRAAVVAAGRKGPTAFELEVDAYTW